MNACPLSGPYEVFVTGRTKRRFETFRDADFYVKELIESLRDASVKMSNPVYYHLERLHFRSLSDFAPSSFTRVMSEAFIFAPLKSAFVRFAPTRTASTISASLKSAE